MCFKVADDYFESKRAAMSEVEQTESGFSVERVFVNLSFISRALVPVSDTPLHTSHFCFFACSVCKWKYKSLPSHGPPPITELKIPAGLPVITGRHNYLKGVVRPLLTAIGSTRHGKTLSELNHL